MALRTVHASEQESSYLDEASFPALRRSLAPQYRHLPAEYIEQIVEQSFGEGVSPEDVENFFSDLGKFAKDASKTVVKAMPTILPVAGTVVGTAFGGPLGGALGGALGSAAGSAVGSAVAGKKPNFKKIAKPLAASAFSAAGTLLPAAAAATGNGAASQLLKTLAQPKVLQGLQSLALGQAGSTNIPIGGTQVPVSAIANLIGSLANQAMAEHHALHYDESESLPAYLLNTEGLPLVDVAVPEQRASVVLNLLQQESFQESVRQRSQQRHSGHRARHFESQEHLDEYYDMLEIASLHDSDEEWEY